MALVAEPPAASSVILWRAYEVLARMAGPEEVAFLADELVSADPSRVALALRGLSNTAFGKDRAREYMVQTRHLDDDVSRSLTETLTSSGLVDDEALISDLLARDSPETVGATLDAIAVAKNEPAPEVLGVLARLTCDGSMEGPGGEMIRTRALETIAVHSSRAHGEPSINVLRTLGQNDACPTDVRAKALARLGTSGDDDVGERLLVLIPRLFDVDDVVAATVAYSANNSDTEALRDAVVRWIASHPSQKCALAQGIAGQRQRNELSLEGIGLEFCEQQRAQGGSR